MSHPHVRKTSRAVPGSALILAFLISLAGSSPTWARRLESDESHLASPLIFATLRVETVAANQGMYDALLTYLRENGVNVYPRAVFGSYLDLEDWILKDRVDLALLPPRVYVRAKEQRPGIQLLATALRGVHPDRVHPWYTSLIVTRAGDGIRRYSDLAGKRPCYVNELSTSGYLLPRIFLESRGIPPHPSPVFSGTHSASLDLLLKSREESGVDFATLAHLAYWNLNPEQRSQLHTQPIVDGKGRAIRIPNDSLVANLGVSDTLSDQVRDLLLHIHESESPAARAFVDASRHTRFEVHDDSLYDGIRWITGNELVESDRHPIENVIESIRRDVSFEREVAQAQGSLYEPRIAVIFSGGGAAGAYQAGIAMEIDKAMTEAGLEPNIVVGTSVGSINGTAMALGHTSTLEDLWGSISLDDILALHPGDAPIGAWRLLLLKSLQRLPLLTLLILFTIAVYLQAQFFYWIGRRSELSLRARLLVLSVIFTLGYLGYGFENPVLWTTLTALGIGGTVPGLMRRTGVPTSFRVAIFRFNATFIIAVLIIVPAEIHRSFLERESLFSTANLHQTLSRLFLNLEDNQPRPSDPALLDARVAEVSRRVVEQGLTRTLVLSTTDYNLQEERYFYLTNDPWIEKRARQKGYVSIAEQCPDKLIDVVVSSAAVFPVLQPTRIELKDGRKLALIDGAYVHNNPVQVALDLGATHVLILKPSPEQTRIDRSRNLLANLFSALGLLVTRSQTEDLKAKDDVMSFLISPRTDSDKILLGYLEFDGRFESRSLLGYEQTYTLSQFLQDGREAAHSDRDGFKVWSRGLFKLPPLE